MKVLPIQQTYFSSRLKLQESEPDKKNNSEVSVPEMSIFAKGASAITFGQGISRNIVTNFEKEIMEQPGIINKLIHKYFEKPGTVNMNLNITPEEIKSIKRIHIYASGSSKNSAEMARGFIEDTTNIPVIIESSSDAINRITAHNRKDDLAIFVSQSGETADTFSALEREKMYGLKTIAVTNNPDSKIAKKAGAHVFLDTGEEKAVAATKTVTSSMFNLMVIAVKLGELKGYISPQEIDSVAEDLAVLPNAIQYMLKNTGNVKQAAKVLAQADNIYYYGVSNTVGSAKEGALKLTETTGKRVIADMSGEALHGTFASIKPDDVVLEVADRELAIRNLEEIVRKRHVKNPIIIHTTNVDKSFSSQEGVKPICIDMPFKTDRILEEAVPAMYATIRFQQLTNEVTKLLGINPDNGGGFLTKFRQDLCM